MSEIVIALPFSIDSYGKINTSIDQSKIWSDRVRSVVGTAVNERVMRPTFGTQIPYTVFNTSESAESEIETEVVQAFEQQLPKLRLQEVTTSTDEYTNSLIVEIVYALPNQEIVTTTLGLASITGTSPTVKEIM